MSRTIRFHLDENVHGAIAPALRRIGIDVITTPESDLEGKRDELQLEVASASGRVLFTHDRDFLRMHAKGVEHAGIAYSIKGRRTIREIVDGLTLLWEVTEPEEMTRRVHYV